MVDGLSGNTTDIVNYTSDGVEYRTDTKNVVLQGENSNYIANADDVIIDLTKLTNKRGIIITSKNVIVAGKVDFTGTIIAGGDLTIENDGQIKKFTYDDNYVLKTIRNNYKDVYSKVFNLSIAKGPDQTTDDTSVAQSGDGTHNIIDNGLVKMSNWKITK